MASDEPTATAAPHEHEWRDTGFATVEDCECGATRSGEFITEPATAAGRGSIAYEPCPQDGHSHDWRDCPTPEDWATTTAARWAPCSNCGRTMPVVSLDPLTWVNPAAGRVGRPMPDRDEVADIDGGWRCGLCWPTNPWMEAPDGT